MTEKARQSETASSVSLDKYLKEVRGCPEEPMTIVENGKERIVHRLTAEYGIYDNFPILLGGDFERDVVDGLIGMRRYRLVDTDMIQIYDRGSEKIETASFLYTPGTVSFIVIDSFMFSFATDYGGYCATEIEKAHAKKQSEDFNISILLHPYQEKQMKISANRALALVIIDIARLAKRRKMSLCFPRSMGWAHPSDLSRIVYYYPKPSN